MIFFELISGLSLEATFRNNNYTDLASLYFMKKLPNKNIRSLIKEMLIKDPLNRLSMS